MSDAVNIPEGYEKYATAAKNDPKVSAATTGVSKADAKSGKKGESLKKVVDIADEIDKGGVTFSKDKVDAMRKEQTAAHNDFLNKEYGINWNDTSKESNYKRPAFLNENLLNNVKLPIFDAAMSLDDIVNKGAGDVDYNRKERATAEANDLSKFQREDGSLDFEKLQKSSKGMKLLRGVFNALGSGLSAAGGSNYTENTGLAGLFNDKIQRQDEAVAAHKEAAKDQSDDQRSTASKANDTLIADWKAAKDANRQVELLKTNMGLSNAAAIEMQKAMNELSLDQQEQLFQLIKNRGFGDSLKFMLNNNPQGAMGMISGLVGGLGRTALGIGMMGI